MVKQHHKEIQYKSRKYEYKKAHGYLLTDFGLLLFNSSDYLMKVQTTDIISCVGLGMFKFRYG